VAGVSVVAAPFLLLRSLRLPLVVGVTSSGCVWGASTIGVATGVEVSIGASIGAWGAAILSTLNFNPIS
jgi:hypothetical protein